MRQVQHWGVTGWSTEWSSLEQADDEGIEGVGVGFTRVVEPGVVYLKPPVAGEWPGWVPSPGNRPRRFQMPWPEDEQPEAITVVGLHERLAPRRATFQVGDEQLQQLDESILEAVRQLDRLHRAGGTLGFVQPDSIVFCRLRDGTLRVVFPDVGFAWDESQGLREPKWIAEPQLDCLLEDGARRQNATTLAAIREAADLLVKQSGKERNSGKSSAALAAGQAADVRMLARLIAVALAGPEEIRRWCGSGKAFLAVPGRDRAPDTQAAVWDQVITPALLDKIPTASAMLERLEIAPPSEHYLFKPPVPPPAWKIAVRRTLPGLAGVAAIVMLALIAALLQPVIFPRRVPHNLCDLVYSGDPRFEQLDKLEEARGGAQAGDLEAVAAYWELLVGAEALPRPCLDRLRQEAAKMVGAQVLSIPARLRDEPMSPTEQIDLLQRAFALATAAEQVSPGDCDRVVGLLLRQLQARGQMPRPGVRAGDGGGGSPAAGAVRPLNSGGPIAPPPSGKSFNP